MRKHLLFSKGCYVSVITDFTGNRSLNADDGECLWWRVLGCPLFNRPKTVTRRPQVRTHTPVFVQEYRAEHDLAALKKMAA